MIDENDVERFVDRGRNASASDDACGLRFHVARISRSRDHRLEYLRLVHLQFDLISPLHETSRTAVRFNLIGSWSAPAVQHEGAARQTVPGTRLYNVPERRLESAARE